MTDDGDGSKLTFEELFELYTKANSSKHIVAYFNLLCKNLNINLSRYYEDKRVQQQPAGIQQRLLYQLIKAKTEYWKSNALWNLYDKKLSNKDYSFKKASLSRTIQSPRVLIIGSGPVGLRLSIECALLGLKVVVVEKRDRFSRNNVLHLWPYTIVDLKNLGAKQFYGKFCAGSIDHISIRKLQCILLKVALLVGVEVHFNVSFEELLEPSEDKGWRARLVPENHILSDYEFDVIVAADGRRNTLPGFKRKEFRGKLAIGITANFVNRFTDEEAEVQERSGVAFIFDQKFFLDLKHDTGIDLENIVYYKDDTHYFVMTAKRQSLIDKGVIKKDYPDAVQLLAKENVNFEQLCEYAKEAAYVSTDKKLRRLDFAKNHYGQPDVAMFDFTSLFQAENASKFLERRGKTLLMALAGDSLVEPFWPTGTGIARGFLAAFDAAWMIRGYALKRDPIALLCERESIYQLLSQTTVDNMSKNYQEYSLDPTTRYLNLNRSLKLIQENQVRHLYDQSSEPIGAISESTVEVPAKRAKNEYFQSQTLITWSQMVTQPYGIKIDNFTTSWQNGWAFCAIIHRFRPDLINDYKAVEDSDALTNIKFVFDLMKSKLGSAVEVTPEEIVNCEIPNKFTILLILDKIYALFRYQPLNDVDLNSSELKPPVYKMKDKKRKNIDDEVVLRKHRPPPAIMNGNIENVNTINKTDEKLLRDNDTKNSLKHISVNNLASILKSKFESQINRPKSVHVQNMNQNGVSSVSGSGACGGGLASNGSQLDFASQHTTLCYMCDKKVYLMERCNVLDLFMHPNCFRCEYCSRELRSNFNNQYAYLRDPITSRYKFYCTNHVGMTRMKSTISNGIQRRRSLLMHNEDEKNVNGNTEAQSIRKKQQYDSTDGFQRKISVRRNGFKPFIKTPERAEFEYADDLELRVTRETSMKISDNSDEDDYRNRINNFKRRNGLSRDDSNAYTDSFDQQSDEQEEEEVEEMIEDDEDEEEEGVELDDEYTDEFDEEEDEDEDDEVDTEEEDLDDGKANGIDKTRQERLMSLATNLINWREDNNDEDNDEPLKNKMNLTEPDMKPDLISSVSHQAANNTQESIEDYSVPPLPQSSPPPPAIHYTQDDFRDDKTPDRTSDDSNKIPSGLAKKRSFICSICKMSGSKSPRITLYGLLYHRDCIKCHTCGTCVKNTEAFVKGSTEELVKFYCNTHFPKEKSPKALADIDDEDDEMQMQLEEHLMESNKSDDSKIIELAVLNDKYVTKRKTSQKQNDEVKMEDTRNDEVFRNVDTIRDNLKLDDIKPVTNGDGSQHVAFLFDYQQARQRAIERAKLKSDEELGLKSPTSIKNLLLTPLSLSPAVPSVPPPLDSDDEKPRKESLSERVQMDNRYSMKLEEKLLSSAPPTTTTMTVPLAEIDFIDDIDDDVLESVEDCEAKEAQLRENTVVIRSKPPINSHPSPVLNNNKPTKFKPRKFIFDASYLNTPSTANNTSTSDIESDMATAQQQPVKPLNSKKSNLKMKLTKILSPSDSDTATATVTPYMVHDTAQTTKTNRIKTGGILKSIFTKTTNRKSTSDSDTSQTTSRTSASDALNESFNALHVTNSPRMATRKAQVTNHNQVSTITSNATTTTTTIKRQQVDDNKRLEKQQRDKRLRMSQEIQRKLDEIENKIAELEYEGVNLEKTICQLNSEDEIEAREKMEQELYNLIHMKNLLTRVQNDLTIQVRALALEDQLSQCQQKLRDTLNIPEPEKTPDMMDSERRIVEMIVELVEEKNQLVEQLEQLRLMERQEDNEVTVMLSDKGYNLYNSNDVDKYIPFKDII